MQALPEQLLAVRAFEQASRPFIAELELEQQVGVQDEDKKLDGLDELVAVQYFARLGREVDERVTRLGDALREAARPTA